MHLRNFSLLIIMMTLSVSASADCLKSNLSKCTTYDFSMPVNIVNSSSDPALTVIGGAVGFNTTSPTELLQLNEGNLLMTKASPSLIQLKLGLYGPHDSTATSMEPMHSYVRLSNNWGNSSYLAIDNDGGDLVFHGGGLKDSVHELMRLTSEGKLGVNVSSVTYGLDVGGDARIAPTFTGGNRTMTKSLAITPTLGDGYPAAPWTMVEIKPASVSSNWNGTEAVTGLNVDVTGTVASAPAYAATFLGGNVGIGVSNPSEKLVVSNGSTTGEYTTAGWTHSSDRRLKHDISSLEGSLEKILRLRGVQYQFNADPSHRTQIGFIAQEVEPIFPEVVSTSKDGLKSMVYANLIAPLVEAVKSIHASTDSRLTVLEKENQELKAYLCQRDPQAAICH